MPKHDPALSPIRQLLFLLLLAQPLLNLPPSSAKWQAEQPGPKWAPA